MSRRRSLVAGGAVSAAALGIFFGAAPALACAGLGNDNSQRASADSSDLSARTGSSAPSAPSASSIEAAVNQAINSAGGRGSDGAGSWPGAADFGGMDTGVGSGGASGGQPGSNGSDGTAGPDNSSGSDAVAASDILASAGSSGGTDSSPGVSSGSNGSSGPSGATAPNSPASSNGSDASGSSNGAQGSSAADAPSSNVGGTNGASDVPPLIGDNSERLQKAMGAVRDYWNAVPDCPDGIHTDMQVQGDSAGEAVTPGCLMGMSAKGNGFADLDYCAIVVHEYGHLLGKQHTGSGVMASYLNFPFEIPQCDKAFPGN